MLGGESGCLGIDIKQVLPFALWVISIAGGEEAACDVVKVSHSLGSWDANVELLLNCKGLEKGSRSNDMALEFEKIGHWKSIPATKWVEPLQ